MYGYSLMLKNGDGIQMDIKEAVKYMKMSADGGELNAINNYANMLAMR